MTNPSLNPSEIEDEILKVLDEFAMYFADPKFSARADALHQIEDIVAKARIDELNHLSWAVVEPCEPDCDAVRHAHHQGTWDAHIKIEERIEALRLQATDNPPKKETH